MFRAPTLPKPERMTVFLAARYPRAETIDLYAQQLERAGFTVISNWHAPHRRKGPHGVIGISDVGPCALAKRHNANRIAASDILVIFGDRPGGRYAGGDRHWEVGFAEGRGVTILFVGDPSTCYQCDLSLGSQRFATWHECLGHLQMLANPGPESAEVAA
jgi:hypothetical protein